MSYYATAAQVVPVLLVVLVIELRFTERREDETFGDSLFFVGFFLGAILAEVLAMIALLEDRNLSFVEDLVILLVIFYGISLIGLIPIRHRMEAVMAALPPPLATAFRYGALAAIVTVVLLGGLGVIGESRLGEIAAVVVLLLIFAGRLPPRGTSDVARDNCATVIVARRPSGAVLSRSNGTGDDARIKPRSRMCTRVRPY